MDSITYQKKGNELVNKNKLIKAIEMKKEYKIENNQ